jgi:hypothetical protein
MWAAHQPKTDVVVAVVGVVPVAVGGTQVVWIVVPGPAAQNASCQKPGGPTVGPIKAAFRMAMLAQFR